jgi:hypothetical protein
MARPKLRLDWSNERAELADSPHAEPFVHPCIICGAPGLFGYGVNLRSDQTGIWACGWIDHRNLAELRSRDLRGEAA